MCCTGDDHRVAGKMGCSQEGGGVMGEGGEGGGVVTGAADPIRTIPPWYFVHNRPNCFQARSYVSLPRRERWSSTMGQVQVVV